MGLSSQVILFFEACILGFLLGMLYDVFRILRLSFPNGRVLIFLEDVLYFAVAAVVSFSFVVLANGGVLRAFLLLGEFLGAVLYFFSLSLLIMKAAQMIIRVIHSFLFLLYRLTIRPIGRLMRWIGHKCMSIFRFFGKRYKIIALNHKKHLKPTSSIVYNDGMRIHEGQSGSQTEAVPSRKRHKWKGRNLTWQTPQRRKTKSL